MTPFLRTTDGDLINADRIERIEDGGSTDGRLRSRAIVGDGIRVTLVGDADVIERALLPVVVAAPGYVHLRYYDDAEEGGDGRTNADRGVADRR